MVMVLLDYLVGIPSPKLEVPERFEVIHLQVQRRVRTSLKSLKSFKLIGKMYVGL